MPTDIDFLEFGDSFGLERTDMKPIIEMNREELLALTPDEVTGVLGTKEIIHIARMFGAFWNYDYEAARVGLYGLHAELKLKYHSDGFFISKLILEPLNIRTIIAQQLVGLMEEVGIPTDVSCVAGIPDSATLLGQEVARILRLPVAKMVKDDGKIRMLSKIPSGKRIILIEDVCTHGTGFIEAVFEVRRSSPGARIFRFNPVILNRGSLKQINAGTEIWSGTDMLFQILPIAETNILDWPPESCRPCKLGSQAIKPKAEPENWEKLVNSQKK